MSINFSMQCVVILDNIRSVHNVGSLFRTADGLGVSCLYLVGVTPQPIDRFGRPRPDLAKVALGAEKTVPWKQAPDLEPLITELKEKGFLILALEQDERSVDLSEFKVSSKIKGVAVMVGNEVEGLSPDTLSRADHILEIAMHGTKESLNVSVATGIALHRLLYS